jgi:MFS family permease
MLGTTMPTPLYVIYQGAWHFSAGIITLIYSTYAAGVFAALILGGQSSDRAGRRPVIAAALALSAASTVIFILAPGLAWLFPARILSGLSAGLMTGTGTAALADAAGPSAARRASLVATAVNMGGLGLGPLFAGLLAQFAPDPTTLPFEIYLAPLVVGALATAVVPETVAAGRRPARQIGRIRLPSSGRPEFLAASASAFIAFSLLGLFSALAPSFLGNVLHEHSHAVAGGVVALIFATATVTQLLLASRPDRLSMRAGLILIMPGLAIISLALAEASLALFLAGTVVGGVAVGACFVGSLHTANRLAPPDSRAQVISAYFTFAYVGLTIPVVAVGFAAQQVGDLPAVSVCAAALAAAAVAALATDAWSAQTVRRR